MDLNNYVDLRDIKSWWYIININKTHFNSKEDLKHIVNTLNQSTLTIYEMCLNSYWCTPINPSYVVTVRDGNS